jgi:hypothetical protein
MKKATLLSKPTISAKKPDPPKKPSTLPVKPYRNSELKTNKTEATSPRLQKPAFSFRNSVSKQSFYQIKD